MALPALATLPTPIGAADRDTPFVRNCWYVAAFADEVSRTPMRRWLLERDVVLYRTEAGQPVALQNRCAHRSFPLHAGHVEGDAIVCNYHGFTYNPDGTCLRVPADDRAAVRNKATLHRYPVVEVGPLIWIWAGEPSCADAAVIPETPWLTAPGWTHARGYSKIVANYLGLHENLLDTTHFGFLHAGNVGSVEYALSPASYEAIDSSVRINRIQPRGVLPSLYDAPMDLVGVEVDRHTDSWYVSPAWHVAHALVRDPLGREYRTEILHGVTPEQKGRTHYFWMFARDYAVDDESVTRYQHTAIVDAFEEDRLALEWIEEITAIEDRPFREVSAATDRAGLHMRRTIAKLAHAEAEAAA